MTTEIQGAVSAILAAVGEDTAREGLLDTPARVERAWKFWTQGYGEDAAAILKTFEDGAGEDGLVVVRNIPFYSHCEHHLAPFFGTASIGYIPDGRIVGLSKLSRLLNMFARRLQVQERMTKQVADSMMEHLAPTGVAVQVVARHMCMESRGVCQQGSETVTTAFRGVLSTDEAKKAEFMGALR